MLALELDRDAFPDEMTVESRPCDDCDRVGFHPVRMTGRPPSRCESCHRADLIDALDADDSLALSRASIFARLDSLRYLPADDPADDRSLLVTDVDVDHGPNGQYIKSITHIVERDCPACGYDRADRVRWRAFTCESGQRVECRACGHTIEEDSTL